MNRTHALLASLACLAAIGCGGGGGGTGGSSNSQARIFVTDDLGNYDHVWVTVKEVDLVGSSGAKTVWQDPTGQTIDLAQLNQAGTQRYAFLGLGNVPAADYQSMRFVMADSVMLYPQGASAGLPRTLAGSSGGLATVTIQGPIHVSGSKDIVADFDLSQWSDDGSTVTPAGKVGSGNGLGNAGNHETRTFNGTLSNLSGTSPTFTFNLSQHSGNKLKATTDADTVIFNSTGVTNPVLANGQHVLVRGTFDVQAGALVVSSIKILGGGDDGDSPEAHGTVASIGTNTFTLTVRHADDFYPANATVNVALDPNATFFVDGIVTTQTDFFSQLTVGSHVEVDGTYDAGTNTFTATRLRIETDDDESGGGGGNGAGHHAEAKGTITNIDTSVGTFNITVSSWQGGFFQNGQVVFVTTTPDTKFRVNGQNVSASDFYAAITSPATVEIEGKWNGFTFTASKVSLEND